MYAILRFLFPDKPYTAGNSWLLLAARIIFGGLLMSHGIAKWQNFDALSASFPDPLGVGGGVSLALAIFGEVICSAGFIAGLFYRLALIPMIFTCAWLSSPYTAAIRSRRANWRWPICRFTC